MIASILFPSSCKGNDASPSLALLRLLGRHPGYSLLATAAAWGAVQVMRRYYQMCTSPLRHVPGPPRANFWTGYFFLIQREPFLAPQKRWFEALRQKDGKSPAMFAYTNLLGRYTLVIMDPDIVQQILTDPTVGKEPSLIRFPKRYKFLQEITAGEGLATLEGPDWSRHRRIIQPSFQTTALRTALDQVVPNLTAQLVDAWTRAAAGRVIDVNSHLSALTLDVIGQVAFAHDFGALANLEAWVDSQRKHDDDDGAALAQVQDPLIRALHDSFKMTVAGLLVIVLDIPWAERYLNRGAWKRRVMLNAATDEIVQKAQQQQHASAKDDDYDDSTPRQHKSLLQLLLEARANTPDSRNALSDVELRDECKTFIVAGHETTSTWCYWTLYALAIHPDVQKNLYAEIKSKQGQGDDDKAVSENDGPLHLQHVENMEYLAAVMEEVLRFYSPVGGIIRYTGREERWHGYTISPDTRVVVPFHMLQRHPDHWKDPETFWPERWLDKEAMAQRHRFVHNPFSGGGRNCIGRRFAQIEAKLIIANLVKAFEIRLAPCMADQEISFSSFLTMKSKTPIKICVQPRGCA